MQQTIQCYRCGAQNYVGQPACQSCGYQFYNNCPRCNAVVDPQFINCLYCGSLLPGAQPQSEPSLHILTLDSQNKEPVGFNVSNSPLILLPAITTMGAYLRSLSKIRTISSNCERILKQKLIRNGRLQERMCVLL